MTRTTKIEWAERTINPAVGCSKVSPGCANCYAENHAARFVHHPNPKIAEKYAGTVDESGKWTGQINLFPEVMQKCVRARKPSMWFVGSMTDLFHPHIPFPFLDQIWTYMESAPRHIFQILTKRTDRMWSFLDRRTNDLGRSVLKNVWVGATVENQEQADARIPALRRISAAIRFISVEPMLGPVTIARWIGTHNCHICYPTSGQPVRFFGADCETDGYGTMRCPLCGSTEGVGTWNSWMGRDYDGPGIDWVICGGESGTKARPMHPEWVRNLADECCLAEVPFFFKQWGVWHPHGQQLADGGFNSYHRPGDPKFHYWDINNSSYRVGKKAAGRVLDGKIWDEYPTPEAA